MAFPPTDWGDWVPAEYSVGAPATAFSFERWFRNPVAMAQGAVGAPRVRPQAIAKRSGWVVGTGANPATIIGLAGIGFIPFGYRVTAASGFAQISITTNGGSTWSGWSNLAETNGVLAFDRTEGTIRSVTGASGAALFTGLSTLNGVRLRASAGVIGDESRITIMDICGMELE